MCQGKKAHREKSRIQLLNEARESSCVDSCNGVWLELTKEVLENNGIILQSFQQALIDLFTKGRGKYRNIMIIGSANCRKIQSPKCFPHFQIPCEVRLPWLVLKWQNVCF